LEQELKDKEFNDYLGQCKKNDELENFKKQQKEKIWMEFLEYTKITENKQKR